MRSTTCRTRWATSRAAVVKGCASRTSTVSSSRPGVCLGGSSAATTTSSSSAATSSTSSPSALPAGFGLAQPAHVPGSHVSHPQTRLVKRSRARAVPFIEAGISVIAPAWSNRVLPFPAWRGMGWGMELEWMDLAGDGCLAGVIDRVTIRHLDPVGERYDMDAERRQMATELAARGIDDLGALQVTLATWRPWQRRPPWANG